MTTTKEFKTLHSLSDSAFNRLTNKIKAAYPDQELTRRVNSRDWKIIDVALFEQYLSYQKREASAPKATEAPQTSAIVKLPDLAAMMAASQSSSVPETDTTTIDGELMDDYSPSALAQRSSGVNSAELRSLVHAAKQLTSLAIDGLKQATEAEKQESETLQIELWRLESMRAVVREQEIKRLVAAESSDHAALSQKVVEMSSFFARRAKGGNAE